MLVVSGVLETDSVMVHLIPVFRVLVDIGSNSALHLLHRQLRRNKLFPQHRVLQVLHTITVAIIFKIKESNTSEPFAKAFLQLCQSVKLFNAI